MAEGFKLNGCNVTVVYVNSFDRNNLVTYEDSIKYVSFSNINPNNKINRIYTGFKIYNFLKKVVKKDRDTVLIFDYLEPYVHWVTRVKNSKKVAIITDFPEDLYNTNIQKLRLSSIKNKFRIKELYNIINHSDYYVGITDALLHKINQDAKPQITIEGLVDSSNKLSNNVIKKNKKVCLYSGALHKRYGIEILVNAFKSNILENYELHLYGWGDCVEFINNTCKMYNNILYFGNIDNSTVIRRQSEATLLINPRPIKEDFTKYSFPSKNLEYMLSGTPVLTTKLPGMPNEYYDYVFLISAENPNNLALEIKKIFDLPKEILIDKAKKARSFVLKNKNNIAQTKRILSLINNQ